MRMNTCCEVEAAVCEDLHEHAEFVRELLRCREEEIPDVEKRYGMEPGDGELTRVYWERAITGRCVYCGRVSPEDEICQRCKDDGREAVTSVSVTDGLEMMDQDKVLVEKECARCGETHELTVSYVLRSYRKYGGHIIRKKNWLCPPCMRETHQDLVQRPFEGLNSENITPIGGIRIVEEKVPLTKPKEEETMRNAAKKKVPDAQIDAVGQQLEEIASAIESDANLQSQHRAMTRAGMPVLTRAKRYAEEELGFFSSVVTTLETTGEIGGNVYLGSLAIKGIRALTGW